MATDKHEKYARDIADRMRQPRTHDFYTGRGANAEYLGTATMEGDVGRIADGLLAEHWLWREGNGGKKYNEAMWVGRVKHLLQLREEVGAKGVSRTWPHPYENSLDTDYSWFFDAGGLYLYNLGALVEIRYPNGGVKSKLRFPNFTPKENTR